jgi:hypothetical protein
LEPDYFLAKGNGSMKALLLMIFFSCSWPVGAQGINQQASRVLADIECRESKRAPGYETFIDSIKRGERGDGIRHSWMDKMRHLGIKQAFFVVHFSYRKGEYKYKVKEVHYLRRYYCYEGQVTSGKLLREIRKSGLERDLKDAIVARIKRFERRYQAGNVKDDDEYHYLLDDETLPIIDFVT